MGYGEEVVGRKVKLTGDSWGSVKDTIAEVIWFDLNDPYLAYRVVAETDRVSYWTNMDDPSHPFYAELVDEEPKLVFSGDIYRVKSRVDLPIKRNTTLVLNVTSTKNTDKNVSIGIQENTGYRWVSLKPAQIDDLITALLFAKGVANGEIRHPNDEP